MDSNFLSRYEKTLQDLEDLKLKDPANAHEYEEQIISYIAKCVPYIKQYTAGDNEETTYDDKNVFGMVTHKGKQKQQIYYKYLENVEGLTIKPAHVAPHVKKTATRLHENDVLVCSKCSSCDVIMDNSSSDLICKKCGHAEFYMSDSNITYKEEQEHEKIFIYSYKRENHFNEWISQFQAQETTSIPDTVLEQLRVEFKKQKIKNLKDITHAKVRSILKKLRLNKYYEHVPYITNILNGVRPPTMTAELEEKLRKMFDTIQLPFDTHCPKERKNFLSYSYVIYKFCELLGEDEFLPCFPLLKSKEKLWHQDVIWKNICKELQWEFIQTI